MFVCVARLTLEIPASGSLKAKRQVLRRVTDRVKARFNVSLAEVGDNDVWNLATIALAVVGNEHRNVNEQMEKIVQFIDDLYVAPMVSREVEVLAIKDRLASSHLDGALPVETTERSLAEAEGLGAWEKRHQKKPVRPVVVKQHRLPLEEARARARNLRNLREWEKK